MRRRRFLGLGLRSWLAGAAATALPPAVRAAITRVPAARSAPEPALIERNPWPEHWETTLAALDRSYLTPNASFFVRSHFPVPDPAARDWKLSLHGMVEGAPVLTLAELRAMPQKELVCTIECAGNGRGLFALPNTSGTQWEYGAVGTARWRGVPLADVLRRAGASGDATDVWFECADGAPFGSAPPFLRSVPVAKARGDVLLALETNGAPLPALHGGPLRAIVPGWYGMASAKWLTGIRVENRPSDGHFMARGYHYQYPGETTAPPVEGMKVKSLITTPLDGARVIAGPLRVAGWAWSGEARVAKLEISTDGMTTWREARWVGEDHEHAWRRWEFDAPVAGGETVTIAARATDAAGETQPAAARANAGGYANNSIHRVTVHARA